MDSFYDEIGGDTIAQIVARFYEGVATDEVLRPIYPEEDLGPAQERFTLFLQQYWGGPGTYTGDTLDLLGRLGYSLAFCTVRRRANTATDGRFEVPRFDTRDLPPYTGGEADAVAASLRDEEA